MTSRVGVVGARGHVGSVLLPLLFAHPDLDVAWVTSSSAAGEQVPGAATGVSFRPASTSLVASEPVDALLLALPNGGSAAWVEAVDAATPETRVVDLSTDHRFDAAWVYGQPERFRDALRGARRVAAPGCYATAAALAVAPLLPVARGAVHVFGVSGYSGAGTTRSERNDPEVLRDNVVPYALVGHAHERELTRHLGRAVAFSPHVAAFFRGLVVTAHVDLEAPSDLEALAARYAGAYGGEPFVEVTADAPRPRDTVGQHVVRVGGLAVSEDGTRAVVCGALDNLLGGAASHAVRSLNLMLGLEEGAGLR